MEKEMYPEMNLLYGSLNIENNGKQYHTMLEISGELFFLSFLRFCRIVWNYFFFFIFFYSFIRGGETKGKMKVDIKKMSKPFKCDSS
jgi:hypothetical protein